MSSDFFEFVGRYLSDAELRSDQARQAAYQQAREDLRNHYWDNGYGRSQYLSAANQLEQAIDQVERGFASSAGDRFYQWLRHLWERFNVKYGALVVGLTLISDLIKPIFQLTSLIAIGSGMGVALFLALAAGARKARNQFGSLASFCALLFACSGAWWGVQSLVPGASAKGVVAEVVPGVKQLQNAVLASLGRIERETRRVGDLLEDSAIREREQQAEARRMQQQREAELAQFQRQQQDQQRAEREKMQSRIKDAGYTLDASGLLAAWRDNYSYASDFEALGINITEDALLTFLPALKSPQEASAVVGRLQVLKDDHRFVRRIYNDLVRDKAKLAAAFELSGAKDFLCNRRNYSTVISVNSLESTCTLTGLRFANKYLEYYFLTYGFVAPNEAPSHVRLLPVHFMRQAANELPIISRGGRLVFSQMQPCQYYEGDLDYYSHGAINPWASLQTPGSRVMSFFENIDPDFGKGAAQRCSMADVIGRGQSQCRARVIIASPCGNSTTVIKLSSAARGAAASSQAEQRPANLSAALADDAPVSASEFLRSFVGNDVTHAGEMTFAYGSNGTFDAVDGRTTSNGRYEVEQDGRVCWRNSRGFSGCFQYFRKGGQLYVRRNDPQSRNVIGPVTVSGR